MESTPHPSSWPALRRSDICALGGFLFLVIALTVPHLPPGICFDDAGDLQIASITLGIEHPPGYAGYVSIGYLISLLPGFDPAYAITLACMACGLIAFVICVLFQLRLGVDGWLACAVGALMVWHPRFWINLRSPEVYMPTLAITVSSAYLLLRYARLGQRRDLFLAALLFGLALGNRPPVLFLVPFFIGAWWVARRAWERSAQPALRSLATVVMIAVLPCLYSFIYVFVRDQPGTCYNYIDNHNDTNQVLPESADGFRARLERMYWEVSAQQFSEYVGTNWRGILGKWRWIHSQITYGGPVTDAIVFAYVAFGKEPPAASWYTDADFVMFVMLAALGLGIAFRRCLVSAWLLLGLIVYCLVFVTVYRVHGQAADLLPLVFAGAVLLGVTGSRLFPAGGSMVRRVSASFLAALAAVLLIRDLPSRPVGASGVDATSFVDSVDLGTFPGPATIIANWTRSVPLGYAKCVLSDRPDLRIITADPVLWIQLAQEIKDQPVYVSNAFEPLGLCKREPFRNIYRLDCPPPTSARTADP